MNRTFTTVTDQNMNNIVDIMSPEMRAQMLRRETRKMRLKVMREKKERQLRFREAMITIGANILVALVFAIQVTGIAYLCTYLGMKEHPVLTQSGLTNRMITGLMQGTLISGLMDYIIYEIYHWVQYYRHNVQYFD